MVNLAVMGAMALILVVVLVARLVVGVLEDTDHLEDVMEDQFKPFAILSMSMQRFKPLNLHLNLSHVIIFLQESLYNHQQTSLQNKAKTNMPNCQQATVQYFEMNKNVR